MALIALGIAIEHYQGTVGLGLASLLFVVVSQGIELLLTLIFVYAQLLSHFLLNVLKLETLLGWIYACGIGYSGVLFAYMIVHVHLINTSNRR